MNYKSLFTEEQIALAAAIGAGTADLDGKIQTLFSDLPDQLLSVSEVKDLLANGTDEESVRTALDQLCTDEFLESSTKTSRPLDREAGLRLLSLPQIKSGRNDDGVLRAMGWVECGQPTARRG